LPFQRGELRSRRFVLLRTATNQLLLGSAFHPGGFTGIHILKKATRIGNLIVLAAANVEAAFKSR